MKVSPQSSSPELVVVMPVYNEASNIASVVHEWFAALETVAPDFLLFAVNDGSTDDTALILERLARQLGDQLRVVNKKNSGHGSSCREGYQRALAEGAAWIFQIDSDGQCDPKFFGELYNSRAGQDCVFGYRRTRDDGLGRIVISRCCQLLLFLVTGAYVKDPNVPYRLMRATALKAALRKVPANFELQNIGLAFALKREPDSSWKYLPIHFRARGAGKSSFNYRRIVKMGMNLLRNIRRITHEGSHPRWARRRLAS